MKSLKMKKKHEKNMRKHENVKKHENMKT